MLFPEPDADTAAANEGDGDADKYKYANIAVFNVKVMLCLPACAAAGFIRRGVWTRRTGPPRPVLAPGPMTRAPVWS